MTEDKRVKTCPDLENLAQIWHGIANIPITVAFLKLSHESWDVYARRRVEHKDRAADLRVYRWDKASQKLVTATCQEK